MFYVAEAFLHEEGLKFSSHAAVIGEFGRVFAKTGRLPSQFHSFLREAQEARLGADYEASHLLSAEEAERHIQNAERFLELAEQFIGKPEAGEKV